MNVLISILISLIAGLSTTIGTLVIFFKIKEESINNFITFCIAFSLSIMIGISITDLIPSSFFNIWFNYDVNKALFLILISFICGVILVLILNKMTNDNKDDLYKLGILNMIALIIHNFPEGIATFLSSYNDITMGIKLSIAIMFHNIPEGIAIAVPIYYATKSKSRAVIRTLISGLSEPLGAILAYIILSKYITDIMISLILLFVAGIMITISIHKMLPIALSYKCNKYIYLGIGVGIILLLFNMCII